MYPGARRLCLSRASDPEYRDATFENYLVIGVAGDYDARAQFERSVVSRLRNRGASASAYYSLVPGNDTLNRDAVLAVVRDNNLDAVLLTRVLNQEAEVSTQRGSTAARADTIGAS